MQIAKYNPEMVKIWDEFVLMAKNGHFFFQRGYMEYHSDRFIDCSLLFFDDRNRLLAIIPASKSGSRFVSHGGLTFGGFLVDDRMTTSLMLEIFDVMKMYLRNEGFSEFIYKCIPYIYHRYPAEEDRYALFRNKAELFRRDVSTAVYLPDKYKYHKLRKRMVSKGKKNGFVLAENRDFSSFIALENQVLDKYHGVSAVHTGKELELLASKFPNNIKLYTSSLNGELYAGTVIFDNGNTVHTQYIANSDAGRKTGALDCLIDYLLTDVYADREYFDFGTSSESDGMYLNEGLIAQKEGFGARAVVHDFYRIML